VSRQVESRFFFKPVEFHLQLANLAVQPFRLLVGGNWLRASFAFKQRFGLVLNFLLPLPNRSRLTGIIKTQFMNENETRLFIEHRLKNADASPVLFDKDAVEIIAAFTRGNRRTLMNTATMALEEAYYLEEKTISASTFYNSEWFNESE
jgi:hypothetical protein